MGLAGLARLVVVLSMALPASGCVDAVEGAARRASPPSATTVTPLAQVLPSDEEIRAAVGNELRQTPPPRMGGIELLPDGIRTNHDADPIDCIGATTPGLHVVYEKGPVRAVAAQDYWNYDLGVVASSATAAAVRLASAADAQQLFTSFVQQWQNCGGTTVTMFTWDSTKTLLYSKVTDVEVHGPILSAVIMSWDNHHTPPFPVERAVGVASDVIADVDVAVRPNIQTSSRATDLVKAMLRRVAGTN